MSNSLLIEIKAVMDKFFSEATDDDIKAALKEANYEAYTGIDPYSLTLRNRSCEYYFADNFSFTYSLEIPFAVKTDYVLCFDCSPRQVFSADNFDYASAA